MGRATRIQWLQTPPQNVSSDKLLYLSSPAALYLELMRIWCVCGKWRSLIVISSIVVSNAVETPLSVARQHLLFLFVCLSSFLFFPLVRRFTSCFG